MFDFTLKEGAVPGRQLVDSELQCKWYLPKF